MTKAYSYIRFSTKEQIKGDSERRQREASEKYVKEHPELTLDSSLNLYDKGISAAKGLNRIKGTLGKFLQKVEAGEIKRGSVLIVENLDRLTREDVLTALKLFISIIEAGITIVTLQDKQEYSLDKIRTDSSGLLFSIIIMTRANDETNTKRIRVSEAWEEKRQKAINGNHKLTKRCPYWLQLSEDRTQYILIPEVCKVIELIYRKRLSGIGSDRIERELNQMPDIWKPPVSTSNKTGGWRKSYINKLLWNDRTLIGEFIPARRIDEKKVPIEGVVIKDYFPEAIPLQLFNGVQALLKRTREMNIKEGKKNNGNGGGQTGKATNLFVGVIKCGLCGSPMHYVNSKHGRQYQYLYCDSSRRKLGCTAKNIRYDELERIFFKEVDNLDISDLLPDANQKQIELNDIKQKIIAQEQAQFQLKSDIEYNSANLFKIKDERVRASIEKQLTAAYTELDSITSQIKALIRDRDELEVNQIEFRRKVDISKVFYKLLSEASDEQAQIDIRLKLRKEICGLVKSIEVYPLQEAYKRFEEIDSETLLTMESKYIDKIRISYSGSNKKSIIFLKSYAFKV